MFFVEKGLVEGVSYYIARLIPGKGKRQEGSEGLLKVIVVGELLAGHNAPVSCEERHSGFTRHDPFLHFTVGFAGVVDEPSNGATGGINDHVLVEYHQVEAL